jgi:hypothetical protein
MGYEESERKIYRVPEGWLEQKRRMSRWIAPFMALFGLGLLFLVLWPRVNWSRVEDRRAAAIVAVVVVIAMTLGALIGRFSFRMKSLRWESFSVEIAPDELIRQMDGQETRIQRANVKSIREYPRRGFLIVDKLGWQIFVPRIVANYEDFRERILTWTNKTN